MYPLLVISVREAAPGWPEECALFGALRLGCQRIVRQNPQSGSTVRSARANTSTQRPEEHTCLPGPELRERFFEHETAKYERR